MSVMGWSRVCAAAAVSLGVSLGAGGAHAQQDDQQEPDSLSLKISKALKPDRFFMRAGAIYVKIKTKSGDTYDVTGPVINSSELKQLFFNATENNAELAAIVASYPSVKFDVLDGVNDFDVLYEVGTRLNPGADGQPDMYGQGGLLNKEYGLPLLWEYLDDNGLEGVGTPPGIRGKAAPEAGTVGLSLGYYLGDDYNWLVESYILAAPLKTSVSISGNVRTGLIGGDGKEIVRPISIDGSKIITSKLLPPTVVFGRYWGDKQAKFRPYTGAMAMYAIFMDTKATPVLNSYVGGSNPGDTTVTIKNAFGIGPVVGFKYQHNDTWHASLNIGHVKLKTQATLTTRNTFINSGDPILNDLGRISTVITSGESAYNSPGCSLNAASCQIVQQNGGFATLVSKAISDMRGQPNLGTFVRKTDTELTNTIFMLSVGRSF